MPWLLAKPSRLIRSRALISKWPTSDQSVSYYVRLHVSPTDLALSQARYRHYTSCWPESTVAKKSTAITVHRFTPCMRHALVCKGYGQNGSLQPTSDLLVTSFQPPLDIP